MEYTFNSLEHWTRSLFTKFGWIILATHDQNIDKVTLYLKSINRLIKCIDSKIIVTEEKDRINDLKILKQQAIHLQYFANTTLTNSYNFKF